VSLSLTGRTFGRLTVTDRAERPDKPMSRTLYTSSWWTCRCDCGAIAVKNGPSLVAGKVKSCGAHARVNALGVPIWDDATISTLRRLWPEGHPASEIGRRLGFSKNAIVGKAHRLDLEARPAAVKLSPQKSTHALRLLAEGKSPLETAREVGCSRRYVNMLNFKGGLAIPKGPVVDRDLFDYPSEPEPSRVLPMFWVAPVKPYIPPNPGTCCWLEGSSPKNFIRCTELASGGTSWCPGHRRVVFAKRMRIAA
jgi:GcrA cell cycle regulator